jgi:hypothetical protein
MESVLKLPQFDKNGRPPKRDHIPIRSISYKKNVKLGKDLDEKTEMFKSLSRVTTPPTTGNPKDYVSLFL